MPRTPLASSLRSLWRDLGVSRRTGVPVDELRARRAELNQRRGPSRRAVLGGAAAGLATMAMPGRARAAAGDPTVAIIGGGIGGLTCALTLLDARIESTVFEASNRIGGRMFSNRTGYWAANQVSEWGGELIDTGHLTVQALADRFGLPLDDLHAAQPAGSTDTYRVLGGHHSADEINAAFDAIYPTVKSDVLAAKYPTTYDSFTAAGTALDHMSIHEWIESRVPGGHASALGQVLDLAYNIEYGAETVEQSALNLLYLLAYQPTPFHGELAMFGVSDEKFHIRGGNQQLPERIAAYLGERVVTGTRLSRIRRTAGGRYELTFVRAQQTIVQTYDLVVLALPFAAYTFDHAQAGFDPLKLQAIEELGRGHNGKLQLQFASRGWLGTGPWSGVSAGNSYSDTGYQSSWEVTRAQAGTAGILNLYSGGANTDSMRANGFGTASDAAVRQDAETGLAQLAGVYPGLSWNGKATQSVWHRVPLYNASYSFYRPGQYTAFGGYEIAPQGGVYFCGEHTTQDYQGYMEGGAYTGAFTGKALRQRIRNA
jgi:monoamine oxidase